MSIEDWIVAQVARGASEQAQCRAQVARNQNMQPIFLLTHKSNLRSACRDVELF